MSDLCPVAVLNAIKQHRQQLKADWRKSLKPSTPSTPVELPTWLDADTNQEKEHANA